jgi:hypothetical protein
MSESKFEQFDFWGGAGVPEVSTEEPVKLSSLQQEWHNTISDTGGRCCVCDRWGKINPRTINATMARSFIWLCKEHNKRPGYRWVDVQTTAPRSVLRTSQLSSMKYWGLIERPALVENDPENPSLVKHTGMWRTTPRGWDFYFGNIAVPKKVFIYNDKVMKESEELVLLKDCFDTDFNYSEVMQSTFADD